MKQAKQGPLGTVVQKKPFSAPGSPGAKRTLFCCLVLGCFARKSWLSCQVSSICWIWLSSFGLGGSLQGAC